MHIRLPLLAAALLALGVTVDAQNAAAQSGPPGVAFVSTLSGDVSVQRGDSGDVEAAGVNAPLMVGDYVSTGPNGRAEVQFDYGHAVRVGPGSQIRFAQLDGNDDTVQLASGTVGVGVVHATSQYTQIETPSVTVRPREAGYYRVTVLPDGTTAITVRRGNAAVLLPQGTRWLDPGSTMLVSGPADHPSFRYEGMVGSDPFDRYNSDRNSAFERADAYRYAPNDPGLYSLSGYGQWTNTPEYGNEWDPNVPADWSPYSNGQWTYEPYYGWTWVDNDPWGYAPFHYGRWYRHHNRWAWVPGPRTQVAAWSPALVAFFGFGNGGGISIAVVDNIGWVPLAPAEPVYAWWGPAAVAVGTLAVIDVGSRYHNARWPNAVRGISRTSFANGGYQRVAAVAPATFRHAAIMRNALPIVPERQALRYTQHPVATAHAPSAAAFHAFRTQPRAPQTFAQARTQAAGITQRMAVAYPAAPPHQQVQQHPQAVEHRPAPVVQQLRPQTVEHRPAPVVQQRPQAVEHRPAPVVQRAQPEVGHVQPQAARPQPAVQRERPQPVVGHPQPAAQQPQPAAQHPQPVVQRPQPVVGRPQPVVQHPQPAVQQPPAAEKPQHEANPKRKSDEGQ